MNRQLQSALQKATSFYSNGKQLPGGKRANRERKVVQKKLAQDLVNLRTQYNNAELAGKEVQSFELDIIVLTVASALLRPCKCLFCLGSSFYSKLQRIFVKCQICIVAQPHNATLTWLPAPYPVQF